MFLDINTFYSPKAGGIRTYHQAKMEWFKRRSAHRYVLVHPAERYRVSEDQAVTVMEVFGPALTRDPAGYRLILDYWRILRFIRRARPQVIEAGDPWLTGLFCLTIRKLGLFRGRLAAFYHSDPVPSYFVPWAARGRLRLLKRLLVRPLGALFYRLQRGYDLTAVSSRAMEGALRARGVRRTAHLPFGVPSLFLEPVAARPAARERLVLYAGRLDREKGVELLLEALPALLEREDVRVSVAGRGAFADRFAEVRHPRFHYLGFLDSPSAMRAAYDTHHVLLAPGPFETFGLGVLEAMARGLLVVGPDAGGTGELLREAGSSCIFPAGDSGAFLRAVEKALALDAAGWEAESGRSRALAETYGTWDQAVGRMVERYAALAEA